MAIPEQMVIALVSLLFFPAIGLLFLVIVLASLGKSLGIRKKYVALLMKVFEFGRTRIDSYNRQLAQQESDSEDEDGSIGDSAFKLPANNHNGTSDPQPLIQRDIAISATQGINLKGPFSSYNLNLESFKREFDLSDCMYFAKCGVETIIEDDVTRCFSTAELPSWNFLSRTNVGYQYISVRLTILYWLGLMFRYFVLFPFRYMLALFGVGWLIVCTAFIGYLPEGRFKRKMNSYVTLMCYRILSRACSLIITYHNPENKASNGLCVANHTSPIDVIVLSCDNCYALVGQSHSGFLGVMQRAMGRATSHIWFERSEIKDRESVARRLRQHVEDQNKLPILIFPEGTCINNTSVMMFKKGSFEVGGKIYPVAIKYDPLFGDAFWNSSKQSMVRHLLDVMTSWALVCDVWYLPPQEKRPGEDAVDFANRVKSLIASKGGLVDLEWDGQLKRMRAKESWKEKTKEDYSKLLKVD